MAINPETLSSENAAMFIHLQVNRQFERLQNQKPAEKIADHLVIRGNGGLTDDLRDDSIGDFEYRQNPRLNEVTCVEFQRRIEAGRIDYARFRLSGWSATEEEEPQAILDTWSLPLEKKDQTERQSSTGVHVGALALESVAYGRGGSLSQLQQIKLFHLLSGLEDGITYDLSRLASRPVVA